MKSHHHQFILKQFFHDYLKEIEGEFNYKDDYAIKILSKYLNLLFIKKQISGTLLINHTV